MIDTSDIEIICDAHGCKVDITGTYMSGEARPDEVLITWECPHGCFGGSLYQLQSDGTLKKK